MKRQRGVVQDTDVRQQTSKVPTLASTILLNLFESLSNKEGAALLDILEKKRQGHNRDLKIKIAKKCQAILDKAESHFRDALINKGMIADRVRIQPHGRGYALPNDVYCAIRLMIHRSSCNQKGWCIELQHAKVFEDGRVDMEKARRHTLCECAPTYPDFKWYDLEDGESQMYKAAIRHAFDMVPDLWLTLSQEFKTWLT